MLPSTHLLLFLVLLLGISVLAKYMDYRDAIKMFLFPSPLADEMG
jgi:hypothetical protein